MARKNTEKVATTSADLLAERIAQLKGLFPETVREGKIDLDQLRAALGDAVDSRQERYAFSWAGKRDTLRILQMPTRATLVPCPEESINWDTTGNLFIEGDNLEGLKLMLKPYYGRVKMIYIDPPYNTGNDFIYPDDYSDPLAPYLRLTGQADEAGNLLVSNPETSGRYHSAWLSMMYPRLFLARQLLREDGVIFVSIDDHEVHNLRLLMNEVFGEESHIGTLVWQSKKGGGSDTGAAVVDHEYVVCYGRSAAPGTLSRILIDAEPLDRSDEKGPYRRGRELNKWGSGSSREDRPTMFFPISGPNGEDVYPIRNDGTEGRWRWGKKKMLEVVQRGDVEFEKRPDGTYIVYEKVRVTDPRLKPYRTWLTGIGTTADGTRIVKDLFDDRKVYDFPKPVELLKHLITVGTSDNDDIVLDFFAGSCTTAQATLELNREDEGHRRFLMVQLPEPTGRPNFSTIADIGQERIRRVIARMRAADQGKLELHPGEDLGFRVFKLAPSNYRFWAGVAEATPDSYAQQLALFVDLLVEGWTPQAVIAEVALKEAGFGLNYRVERAAIVPEHVVFQVSDPERDQAFWICLDDCLALENLRPLFLTPDDLFVCRDVALDDEAAANLALQCRLKTI